MKPQTKYTKSGRISIAYQVIGDGPIDLVYIPGWVSNIDLMWECPQLVKFLDGLAKFARVILFDKRGTGLSDRVIELSSLEERMDDIRAVMDAVGSERAALFGHSEGGSVSALFAATYPDRSLALITFGVFAKRRYTPDYPWAPKDEERQEVYNMIETSWGSGDMDLVSLAPSMAGDKKFMDWLARYFRSGASPSAALALTKMNTEVDIIDILDTIEVPTLLMCRTHDIDVKIEESQFMAKRIRGAKFVEFQGEDHLFWAGDTDEVLDEITVFMTGARPVEQADRRLATIVNATIVGTQELMDSLGYHGWEELQKEYLLIVRRIVMQYRGSIVNQHSRGFMATFDGPSKAVHCAEALRNALLSYDITLVQGIHTGECILQSGGDIRGIATHIAKQVRKLANVNEILLTETVKNLLSGAGLQFREFGRRRLPGVEGEIGVLILDENEPKISEVESHRSIDTEGPQNHSFLENVLQSIETHMSDEDYGVDRLCLEVGLSERQLQRKLKLIANKTPNQMVRSVRLHKAKEIIISSTDGISQAAYKTGFSSLSYFSKCFRKEFGVTPKELTLA